MKVSKGSNVAVDADLGDSELKPSKLIERPPWKIIIADDHEEIHSVTKLVLDDFSFEGRGLQILSAYSGKETKALVEAHPDIAFILLDVVMETDDAGLDVIRYIREELNNNVVQIVLNTGQPGQAPEHEVITRYHINDYKSKTEFSSRKLLTSITASLRAYDLSRNLHVVNERLNEYRHHLEDLVRDRTVELEKTNRHLKKEVDERTAAEAALQQSHDILDDILTASPIGICLINDGHIEWVNEAMLKLFGFVSDQDYKNHPFKRLTSSESEYERIDQIIRKSLSEGDPVVIDAVFQRRDGSTFMGNLQMSCRDPKDYDHQAIVTISDITWRMQAEQDRVQKERLQGALEMSGSVCHELNQPLQYVSGSIEILMMDLSNSDPLVETIMKMKTQVDRMGNITKKLMGITSYRTRDYVGGRKIIDIDKASEDKSAT